MHRLKQLHVVVFTLHVEVLNIAKRLKKVEAIKRKQLFTFLLVCTHS